MIEKERLEGKYRMLYRNEGSAEAFVPWTLAVVRAWYLGPVKLANLMQITPLNSFWDEHDVLILGERMSLEH